jgi:RecA-family ATPase
VITAEDGRGILVARLRELMKGMGLSSAEQSIVFEGICIWDVTGEQVKLLQAIDGNVRLTSTPDQIIRTYRNNPPVMIVFDPVISFGAGESYVNDNEQGLITAGRRIVRALGCCVRFVAHTGKANAREKTLDQYSSRGGSALSDGARMVAVMQAWRPNAGGPQPPDGCTWEPGSSITILARPKLSYARLQPVIWIKRSGWCIEHVIETQVGDDERERALLEQVERFIGSEVAMGRRHSLRSLEADAPGGLRRSELRRAVEMLMARGRVVLSDLPADERHGGRKKFLSTAPKSAAK